MSNIINPFNQIVHYTIIGYLHLHLWIFTPLDIYTFGYLHLHLWIFTPLDI